MGERGGSCAQPFRNGLVLQKGKRHRDISGVCVSNAKPSQFRKRVIWKWLLFSAVPSPELTLLTLPFFQLHAHPAAAAQFPACDRASTKFSPLEKNTLLPISIWKDSVKGPLGKQIIIFISIKSFFRIFCFGIHLKVHMLTSREKMSKSSLRGSICMQALQIIQSHLVTFASSTQACICSHDYFSRSCLSFLFRSSLCPFTISWLQLAMNNLASTTQHLADCSSAVMEVCSTITLEITGEILLQLLTKKM